MNRIDYKEYRLGNICSRLSSGKGITAEDIFEEEQYPVFGGNGLRGYTSSKNFTGACAIVGRQGAYCGNVKYFEGEAYMSEHAVVVVANPEHNTRYLAFVLDGLKLGRLSGQAAQPGLSVKQLAKIRVFMPNKAYQDKVSCILSKYDQAIEINNKRIKILEQMAENLYREWFVRFRFPGHEDVEFVGGIPKGWTRSMISDISSVNRRGISPEYDDEGIYTVISQKCIRSNIMDVSEARRQSKSYKTELNLQDADTVICSTGTGTLGRVGKVVGDFPETTYDSHVTLVRAKDGISKQYLYGALKEMQPWFMNMGIGSTNQQELYISTIRKTTVLIPEESLMERYESIAKSIHDEIGTIILQNINLIKQRDLLLPRLMSGRLSV